MGKLIGRKDNMASQFEEEKGLFEANPPESAAAEGQTTPPSANGQAAASKAMDGETTQQTDVPDLGTRGDDVSSMSGKKKAGIAVAIIAAILLIVGGVFAFGLGESGKVDVPDVADMTVPDVTGMTADQAQMAIEEAGYRVGEVKNVYDAAAAPQAVVGQSPKGGDKAEKGSMVSIDVMQGGEESETPDVVDTTPDKA